jgi:alpha-tubulin suppressor-like RCC1 family protein
MEGVESEELESVPMLVEGLQDEGFKAVRVDAGDSVSLALSDRGELRCWGSFRVSSSFVALFSYVLLVDSRYHCRLVKDCWDSVGNLEHLNIN